MIKHFFALSALTLLALPAVATPVNVALTGTARQSTTWEEPPLYSGAAWKANDGNTNNNFFAGSVTHTWLEQGAWWEVSLDRQYAIESVTVFNRGDCCSDRTNPFTVSVWKGSASVWSSEHNYFDWWGGAQTLTFSVGVIGDRVRVQLEGAQVLSLAEVQVMAAPVPEPESWSLLTAGLATLGWLSRRRTMATGFVRNRFETVGAAQ